MPAPTMMTSSPINPPGMLYNGTLGGGYNRLVAYCQSGELRCANKAHAHARSAVRGLAGKPPRAGPAAKTPIIRGVSAHQPVAMCTPAIAVFRAGQFLRTAQLRPAGKTLGIVRRPAVAQRGKDVAPAGLVAEEMRR